MKVNFKEVFDAVQKVRATIASDATIEVFSFLCFRDGKVLSFDGSTGTITKSYLDDLGNFCVPGKKFVQIVAAIKDSTGTMGFADNWLHIRAKNFKTKLPTYPIEDFPNIAPLKTSESLTSATNVQEALRHVSVFVEKDPNKSQITGIGFEGSKVYSTDGKRVTCAGLDQPAERSFTITKEACDQILRLGPPDLLFHCQGSMGALYKETQTVVIARQTTKKFPIKHIRPVFDREVLVEHEIPETLREVVDRVYAFSEDDEGILRLSSDGAFLKVATADTEVGGAQESLEWATPLFQVKLKGNALKTLLRSLKPTHVDLTDLVKGDGRFVGFRGEGYDLAFAAMV